MAYVSPKREVTPRPECSLDDDFGSALHGIASSGDRIIIDPDALDFYNCKSTCLKMLDVFLLVSEPSLAQNVQ